MRKHIQLIVALLVTCYFQLSTMMAQTPEGMSYQAVIRNSSDQLVTNTNIGMQISILQGSISGTVVYAETQNPTTNDNGLVSIEIGDGTVVGGNFTTIDWAAGPYFIKTETDLNGGASYTLTGTSQLLSVPYALHAKTADNITGGLIETDPIWLASPSFGITGTNISNWNSAYGWGDHASIGYLTTYTETDPLWVASPSFDITSTNITNWSNAYGWGNHASAGYLTDFTELDPNVPSGTQTGEMQYWNGTAWVTVPAGNEGQFLTFNNGVPVWVNLAGAAAVGSTDVYNPATDKVWMDRNLGALQVAISSTDADAYGDLYQWGRATDGHQIRTSGTTSSLSSTDTPGHGNFILAPDSPNDWRSPQNDNLWQGVSGTNNPCPSGYRIPTEAEWEVERLSWSSNTATGAYYSPLKLPVAGARLCGDGSFVYVGSVGHYWSSNVDGTYSRCIVVFESVSYTSITQRANGLSVRCIKN